MALSTTPSDENRPDPDKLLLRLQEEAARAQRGRLKIFFGASAGVGKTYAMLLAARAANAQGVPLLVGVVETHGRQETLALVEGLPLLALQEIAYRGHRLKEFDLDAALAFGAANQGGANPPLILLDELAHSNVPGSRHPKRWQDAEELLAAGIDVWSTMNVQHLESLNDIIGGITGIRVFETLPDTFFDSADDVVLIDLPPDELLERLAAGKVYIPAQAKKAAENFFRKGNLIALRELSLRRTADRVDSQMQRWRREGGDPSIEQPQWSTRDALLACVGAGTSGEVVVRSAARLATQTNLPWHAVFVDAPAVQRVSLAEREQIKGTLKLAQELGATTATPSGTGVAETLARYAREHNLSRLVIGRRPERRRWQHSLTERLAELTPDMDILQVPLATAKGRTPERQDSGRNSTGRGWQGYAVALVACVAVAAVASSLHELLELTNIVMLFLLAVVGVALRHGRGPATLAAVLGVAMFDFSFVHPLMSFEVSDMQYLITFGVMLLVALVVGHLTASLHAQARTATERERQVRGLYHMSRELSAALLPAQVADIGVRFLAVEFSARSALLMPDDRDRLQVQPNTRLETTTKVDIAVAQWCFDKGEVAGRGTNTLAASACLMLPLKAPMRIRGVLAIESPANLSLFSPEQRQLLDTCASLLAISLERIHYLDIAQRTTIEIESERLRNSLLSAISHDLRTPLTTMVGLADTLNLCQPGLTQQQAEIAAAIRTSALRMSALVNNLLDMAQLESGGLHIKREWLPLDEVLGSALKASAPHLQSRHIMVKLDETLPLLHLDAALFERVLVNLLENAAKYTPPSSPLTISARLEEDRIIIVLDDAGPGLPPGKESAIFNKFERGNKEAATPGVGLGLAICRAIVQAHGGLIHGENRFMDGQLMGARFVISLPHEPPPADDGSNLKTPDIS